MDFGVGDPLDSFHSFRASSKHSVLVVQPGLRGETRKVKDDLINMSLLAIESYLTSLRTTKQQGGHCVVSQEMLNNVQ